MSEIVIKWNQAALETLVEEVQFMYNVTLLLIKFAEHQQDVLTEWQQHIWEIM